MRAVPGNSSGRPIARVRLAISAIWLVFLAITASLIASDVRLAQIGRSDLNSLADAGWVYLLGIASAAVVGSALALRRPRHPVGWLFLGLASALLLSGALGRYATYGILARPGSLPGARVAVVFDDTSFVAWFVLVSLILSLTPNGTSLSSTWRHFTRWTVALGVVAFVTRIVSDTAPGKPFGEVHNPMAIGAISGAAGWIHWIAVMGVALGLVLAAVSLVVRFRRSRGEERRQLLWLTMVVIPVPLLVLAAFVAAYSGHDNLMVIATGTFIGAIPVAVGLSISKYHLYDVDRILGRTLTYVLLTLGLLTIYATVVLIASRGFGSRGGSPAFSATLAAVTAAVLAAPMRTTLQDLVDRRFNKRRYEAIHQVREANRTGWVGTDVQDLLARALSDPTVHISYWLPGRQGWVDATGAEAEPQDPAVELTRVGMAIARVAFDPAANDPETVRLTAVEALVAVENVGLRAELGAQLLSLAESRTRIVTAQQDERERIGRDLHDGAQQRLLALALQLQAAQLNGSHERLREAVGAGVGEARLAVEDLRELANGLHPIALTDGGLSAALDDLARRSPSSLNVTGSVPRIDPAIESTAWFIACEAISNAQKHATATHICVDARVDDGCLLLEVIDDGCGGADPNGSGIRGIRDRTEAAGGTFVLGSSDAGTTIRMSLPCGS